MARPDLISKTFLKFLALPGLTFSSLSGTGKTGSKSLGLKRIAARVFLVITAILFINANIWGQTTRYWVGGASAAFNVATSWSTTLGGAGNGVPVAGDNLIVDGSDISSVAGAQTGAVTITTWATIVMSSFTCRSITDVTLTAAAGRTLTLGNGATDDLVIQSGSTLNISTNMTVTMAIGASGLIDGTLIVGAGRTFTSNNAGSLVTVNGSVFNAGTVTTATNRMTFASGSNYYHTRNAGLIPLAAWNQNSTCNITGIQNTVMTNIGADPQFGNFVWDCPLQTAAIRLTTTAGQAITVNGNMSIFNTGTGSLIFTDDDGGILRIAGNLTIGNGINTSIFNIKSAAAGATAVELGGNLNVITGNTLTSTDNTAVTFNFGFTGATGSTIATWSGGGTYTNTYINYLIQDIPSGKTVNLTGFGGNPITIETGRTLTVGANATLNCADQTIAGTGTFILQASGILGIGHVNGINDNLTITNRTLNENASNTTFVYNGTASQVTGTNLPSPLYNLNINNPTRVTLSASLNVSNSLTMVQGNIITNAFTLALINPAAGSLSRTSGTIIGKFSRSISTATGTDYLFPVGTAGNYRPAEFNFTSLGSAIDITSEFIAASPVPFVGYTDDVVSLTNAFTDGYWRFFSSSAPAANYNLSLTGTGFSSYIIDEITRISGRDNGNATWRAIGSHNGVAGSTVTRTGATNLNTSSFDYAFATGCASTSLGYAYERNISINSAQVSGGTDLSNFPVMIRITGQTYLQTYPAGQIINPNGYDIIFTDDNYNKLDHQIEYYNGTTGDLIAWVRIPTLSASSNTIIKILYGNSKIYSDQSTTAVWDSHYKGVWHFNNNSLKDYTSFNKAGTGYNTPSYPGGQINNALGLNGSNQYAVVINDPNINITGNLTVSAWINMGSGGIDQKIAGNQNGTLGGFKFGVYPGPPDRVEFEIRNATNTPSLNRWEPGGTTLNTGQWYYVAGNSSDVLDSIRTFVNGIPERPFKKTGTLVSSSNNLTIGKEPFSGTAFWNGRIDELRISDEVRSNGWLRTEYNNQLLPATFYSIDALATSANNLPSESVCNSPITLTFGFPSGGVYSGDPNIAGNIFTPPGAGTYSITYTYTGACGPTSDTKDIIITDAPSAPVAPNKEYCTGFITYLNATSGTNIKWYEGGLPVSTANPFSTGKTAVGTYNYEVTQTVNGCESARTAVTLTIFASTSITSQPVSISRCAGSGSTAGFRVRATGPNLTYQWRKGATNLVNGPSISGATSDTLTISNLLVTDAGNYTCVVSSSCGASLPSNIATLQVNAPPTPTINGNNVVCPFSSIVYNITDVHPHTYKWVVTGGAITGSDTVPSITVIWGPVGGGTVTVTETVSPGCFTTTPALAVSITDTTIPLILTCPANINVTAAPGTCTSVVSWTEPVGSDNCTAPGNLVWTRSHAPGSTFTGTTTVTYTAKDETGNESLQCSFIITVADNQNPTIIPPADVVVGNDAGFCTASSVSLGVPVTADNCSVASVINDAPATFPLGNTTVTWTVTDGAGNSATATQTVTVNDTEDPVAQCILSYSVYLDISGNATITAGDIDNGSTDNCGIASMSVVPNTFTIANLGPNPVVLTVTDNAGNFSTCNSVITVVDNSPPIAICKNITVQLGAGGTVTITGADVDNGSNDPDGIDTRSVSPDTFDCNDIGPNNVTLTVTDFAGKSSTCTAVVTVEDNIVPTIACPGNVNVFNDPGVCGAVINYVAPVGNDNCAGAVTTQTAGLATGSVFPIGTTINTFLVTDASGHTASCSFTVTVSDNEGPSITLPAPPVLNANALCQASVPAIAATYSDNCTPLVNIIVSQIPAAGATIGIGVTTVAITATDLLGNSTNSNIDVTVVDVSEPVITPPVDPTLNLDGSCQALVPNFLATLTVSDNCTPFASLLLSQNPSAGTTINGASGTPVKIYAEDSAGNIDSVTVVVTTQDITPPVMACKDATLYLNGTGTATLNPADVNNGSSDNCTALLSYTLSKVNFNCSNIGPAVSVTLTGTDAKGNSSTCSSFVTVLDTVGPTVNVKTFNLILGPTGTGTLLPSDVDNGSFDNCGAITLSVSPNTFDCNDQGPQTVTLTATDANLISRSKSVVITVSSSLSIDDMSLNSCDLAAPFALYSSEVSGGNGTYSYLWNVLEPGAEPFMYFDLVFPFIHFSGTSTAETPFFNNLMPDGTYNIRLVVTDGNGCVDTSQMVMVKGGTTYNNVTTKYSDACENQTKTYTVAFDATATYSWSVTNGTILTPINTNSIDVIWDLGGTQGVVIGNTVKPDMLGNDCGSSVVDTVAIHATPVPAFNSPILNVCGDSEITYTLTNTYTSYSWTITGGVITAGGNAASNFVTVRWGTGATGKVSVSVVNGFSCSGSVFVDVLIFNLSGTITSQTNVSCNGASDGAATALATAGTGLSPYEYKLDAGSYQASGIFTGISIGNHTITIRDALLCTFDLPVTITQPAVILGSVSSQTNVSCNGGSDGSVTIAVSGGTAPYQYNIDGGAYQGSNVFNGLTVGAHTATVQDVNLCTVNVPVTIIGPTPLVGTISLQTNVDCNGNSTGAVTVAGSGGTAPYEYRLDAGAYQASGNFTGLASGGYAITVRDATSCTVIVPVTITQPIILTGSIVSQTNVLCFGNATGQVTLTGSGGTPAYQYSLDGGAYQVSPTFMTLTAGSYTVTIRDVNSCTVNVPVIITQPAAALTGSTVVTNVLCFGNATGAVNLTVAGGTGPFTFLWSNGATTEDLTNVVAGNYTVVITDANGCTANAAGNVTQPAAALTGSTVVTNVLCFGNATGAVNLTVAGGTGPFTFLWSNGATTEDLTNVVAGNYTVVITDANGCTANAAGNVTQPAAALTGSTVVTNVLCFGNATGAVNLTVAGGTGPFTFLWSNGATTEDLTNVVAGNYTVVITDANGCTANAAGNVTQPAAALTGSTVVTNVLCFGNATGAVNLTVAGGTGPFTFLWSNGATTEDLTNVVAGNYTVVITDANGCTANAAGNVTQPAAALTGSTVVTNVLCFGNATGAVNLTVAGGTGPFTFLWSNGATTEDLTNVVAGNYTVVITDANGCTANAAGNVTQPAAALTGSTVVTNVLCFGNATGAVNLTVAGGTGPFTFLWSNGATTEDLTNVVAGNYTVVITDANGCTANAAGNVTQPAAALTGSTVVTNVLCFGNATGAVNLTVAGGTGPFTFLWSNGATTEDLTNVVAGNYTVVITDANGCTANAAGNVTQPAAALTGSTVVTNVLCFGNATGAVNLTVAGGTGPFTFLWSNGATTEDLTNVVAGNYTVVITDANGCTANAAGNVTQPAAALTGSTVVTNVLCFGNATGAVNLTVAGGTGPFTFLWSNGATTEDLTNVVAGNYTVVITDANGCTANAAGNVTQPAAALTGSTVVTNVLCFGNATGAVNLTVAGGTGPFTFLWSNGATTEDLTNVVAGNYTVVITDANGCTANAAGNVTQPAAALTGSTVVTNVLCFGNATGAVNLTVAGGTGPFTFLWSNGATTEDLTNVVAGNYTVVITDANGCTANAAGNVTQPAAALTGSTVVTNVLCFGNATGAVNLTVAGGTGPFTFLWSNGATTEDLTNVVAGNYTVVITDANGCTANAAGNVTQPAAALTGSTVVTNVLCFGNATGAVNLTVAGGTGPFTFLWSNGATTEDLTNVVAGNYTVVITDANGCTANAAGNVTQPAAALTGSTVVTNVLCFGNATGAVNLTVAGGTGPFTFLWSNGATTEDLTNVVAGNYTVVITDANGCTANAAGNVTQPAAALTGSTVVTNVLCFGNATGAVNLTVAGGTGPFTFLWSNGATTEDLTNVVAGNYTVVITDANGCTANAAGNVTQPAAALTGSTVVTNVLCFGNATGAVNLTVAGGTGPFTFLWSNGATTEDLTNVVAGNYTVVITDANGCTANAAGNVTQPAAALTGSTVVTNVLCFGNATGAVNLTVAGGTGPFTFLWSNGATTEDLTNVVAGNYTVVITDANGCTANAAGNVTQPAAALTGSTVVTNVLCFGNATGAVNLTVAGGTGPFTFLWSNGATTEDLTNVVAGNYTVVITDANGCTANAAGNVTQPAAALTGSTVVTNVLCFGNATGAVNLTVAGGTGPFTFLWSNGATTEDLTNVVAGNYTVVITDANGCTANAAGNVTQPAAALTGSTVVTNVLCFGNATGAVNLTVAGGTGPFTFLWSNGATTEDLTNVVAGNYTVVITDANGCTANAAGNVTQPAAALTGSTVVTNVLCFGNATGAVNLTVAGGTGPFTFLWSNGATTEDLTNVVAGNYTVVITDANGCTANAAGNVTQPAAALTGSTVVTNVLCFGNATGAVNLTVAGGTGPFTFLWSNGATTEDLTNVVAGNYTVVITDANGCTANAAGNVTQPAAALTGSTVVTNVLCFGNATGAVNLTVAGGTGPFTFLWSNGATTEDLTNVVAGNYTVVITDANGCTANAAGNVTQPAAALTGSTVVTNVLCFGNATGAVNLTVAGGTGPFTFLWSNGATTEDLTNVVAGNYTVVITDANGCTANAAGNVTQPAAALTGSTVVTNVLCFGNATGAVNLTVAGGTGPFTFLWSNGATTEDLTNVVAGNYTVVITDANGCTANAAGNVTQPAAALTGSTVVTNVLCFGNATGAVNLTVAGGTGPFTFLWSNGATTEDLTNVVAGNYTVVITDANGCTANAAGNVTQPAAALTGSTVVTNVLCFGNATGAVNLTVAGGTGPFTFLWSNGATTEDLTNVVAGNYTVVITDANGCTANAAGNVTQPAAALTGSTVVTNVLCFGNATGAVNLTVAGGTGPFTFLWSNGATTEDLTNVVAGNYTVVITDANGCTANAAGNVTQPAAALTGSTVVTNVLCFGNATGAVNLTVAGGTGPFTFLWSNGATTEDLTNVVAGNYTVVITDANGCTANAAGNVTQPAAALSGSTLVTNVLCNGGTTGTIDLTVAGGTGPFTFLWSNGATIEDLPGVGAGTYSVVITDANSCTANASGTITEPSLLSGSITSQADVLCFGGNTGSVTIAGSGGTPGYLYRLGAGAYQFSGTFNALTSGLYSITVRDANMCTVIVPVTINQPAASLTATIGSQTDVMCFGNATGSVTVAPAGGTLPYVYKIDAGIFQPVATFSSLLAGIHTIVVRDANLCVFNLPVTITQPPTALSGSIVSQTNVLCFGGSTGSVTVTGSGGTPVYEYAIDAGPYQPLGTFNGLSTGVHTVTVRDMNQCTFNIIVSITQPGSAISVSATKVDVLCNGAATGSATATASGGTLPYSYSWSTLPVQITATATGLIAGTYTVTVTDGNGCIASTNATISEPASAPIGSTSVTNVLCNGGLTGAIDLTVSGGTSPYTFLWSNGATSEDLSGVAAGNYTIVITDASGCTANAAGNVTEPAVALAGSTSVTNVLCNGGLTGAIDLTVSGGTSPYTFLWSNGATSEDLSGVAAGNYTVVITDASGCTANAAGNVTEPAVALAGSTSVTNVLCNGGLTGAIDLTVSGGTSPYTFLWSNGATSEDLSGVAAGNYTVVITDASGCTANAAGNVTEPAVALAGSTSVTNVLCNGGLTGAIDLTVSGGTSPYTFLWSNGATSEDLSGVAAGNYTIVITDASGCTANAAGNVTEPAVALAGSTSVTNVLCNGGLTGAIDLTVSGGTSPYTFLWSNGATSEDLSGVAAGNYTVVITDASGCTANAAGNVTEPAVALAGSTSVTNVLCNGGLTGAIDLTVSGGTSPYTFLWSNGATSEDLSGVAAGNYTVVITDASGCTANAAGNVTEPAVALAGSTSVTNVLCNGGLTGAIDLTVSGGTSPYTFLWSNGATSEDLSGVAAGNYTVVITDASGCTANAAGNVTEPAVALAGSTSVTNVLCNGGLTGAIDLTVSGGTSPYTFLWSNGATSEDLSGVAAGNYTVVITDASGCTANAAGNITEPVTALSGSNISQTDVTVWGGNDGSVTVAGSDGTPGYLYKLGAGAYQVSGTFSSLTAGNYTVTVQDANLCTFDVPVTITQPLNPLTGSVTQVNVLCNGGNTGSVTVTGIDGLPPYEYSIDAVNYQTSGTFNTLTAGSYTFTVRDALLSTFGVPVTITEPALLTVSTIQTDVLCSGGSTGNATATAAGGTGLYTYSWNTTPVQATSTASGLAAGTYIVTVTDANLCTANTSVIITQPSLLSVSTTQVDVSCNGDSDGSATAVPSGGTGPYTYSWSTSPAQTSANANGLIIGTYTVTLTDANGCTATANVTIIEPDILVLEAIPTPAGCPNSDDGSIDLIITGGTAPYSPNWFDGGITTEDRLALLPGTYSVVVTDANGCNAGTSADVDYTGSFACLRIPDIITPEQVDGHNDEWIIENIDIYPNAELLIYSRWGKLIYKTKNVSANPWNGKYSNGKFVPTDSYHYILYLGDGSEPRSGVISVIR